MILIQLDSDEFIDVSEMEISLIPNGIEGVVPEGTSAPIVSIDNLDGSPPTTYKFMGFHLLVPSYHALLDKQFDSELQFLHKIEDDTLDVASRVPSFFTIGVWIHAEEQEDVDSNDTSLATTIERWQQAVELLETSCNIVAEDDDFDPEEISTDSLATGANVPVVVGRGDEHNFANEPIRRLEEKTGFFGLYNRMVVSSSFYYSFEERVSCDWKDDAIVWSFASIPLNISKETMETITGLLERHIDPHECQPLSRIPIDTEPGAVAVTKNNSVENFNIMGTKMCLESPENHSESSNALSAGMLVVILASFLVVTLVLS